MTWIPTLRSTSLPAMRVSQYWLLRQSNLFQKTPGIGPCRLTTTTNANQLQTGRGISSFSRTLPDLRRSEYTASTAIIVNGAGIDCAICDRAVWTDTDVSCMDEALFSASCGSCSPSRTTISSCCASAGMRAPWRLHLGNRLQRRILQFCFACAHLALDGLKGRYGRWVVEFMTVCATKHAAKKTASPAVVLCAQSKFIGS